MPSLAQQLYKFLFDTSSAQKNRQEVEDILMATLLLSESDADFRTTLLRVLAEWEGGPEQGQARFYSFMRFMSQHRRRDDRKEAWHIRANHLLEDLPAIYGEQRSRRQR